MKQFIIPFAGLKSGKHEFSYHIDNEFFNEREYSLVKKGEIKVDLVLNKYDNTMTFDFDIKGFIYLPCDRCNEEFKYPLKSKQRLLVKQLDEHYEESDELVLIPKKESEFDITQHIYEYINLMVPMKAVHPDDENGKSTCNQDVLDKLSLYSAGNKQMDSRWDVLKNVKLK